MFENKPTLKDNPSVKKDRPIPALYKDKPVQEDMLPIIEEEIEQPECWCILL